MTFQSLFDEAMAGAPRFGHREHVHLTWLAVREHGTHQATAIVDDGIRAAGGDKYHATITRAWVELVGYHVAEEVQPDFDAFLRTNPALLDKTLLTRFYHPETLAAPAAKAAWVAPDKKAFPA